jgi:hypothetical protein
MIQFVAQGMMEMDTESLCAAAYWERSLDRANSRNAPDRHLRHACHYTTIAFHHSPRFVTLV